jgi:hypothetical protein
MSQQDDGTNPEKATVLRHNALALFPADHLAPWMSDHKEKQAGLVAMSKAMGKMGIELDRRVWLDEHPGKPLPEGLQDEEFAPDRVRGGAGMLGFCLVTLAQEFHDIAPSIDGKGRRQAMGISVAHGTAAVAQEPKKRSIFEKLTGKNKEADKAS